MKTAAHRWLPVLFLIGFINEIISRGDGGCLCGRRFTTRRNNGGMRFVVSGRGSDGDCLAGTTSIYQLQADPAAPLTNPKPKQERVRRSERLLDTWYSDENLIRQDPFDEDDFDPGLTRQKTLKS